MTAKYDFETIKDASVTTGPTPGVRYRVRYIRTDCALAHCYDKANAQFIVDALNAISVDYMGYMREAMRTDSENAS
jgi:hypothetical protein